MEAARAGRPILVENPIALTAAEGAARRRGPRAAGPAAAALFLRELPALRRLAGVLAERLLGRVASVSATWVHRRARRPVRRPTSLDADPARAGVGGFGDLALHLVDALSTLPADAPPALAAVALDRDGAGDVGGQAVGSWGTVPLSVRAGWASRPGAFELVVCGAAGTATVSEGVLELDDWRRDPQRWVGPPPDAGEALRAFAARLRTRRRPPRRRLPRRAQAVLEAAVTFA